MVPGAGGRVVDVVVVSGIVVGGTVEDGATVVGGIVEVVIAAVGAVDETGGSVDALVQAAAMNARAQPAMSTRRIVLPPPATAVQSYTRASNTNPTLPQELTAAHGSALWVQSTGTSRTQAGNRLHMTTSTHRATSVDSFDEPVLFPEPENTYFGILSIPTAVETGTTGVVLLSGTFGGTTTVGRNRMWVKMARELAADGYPVLRFDYAGLGDSVGEMVCYELETPALPELNAAFDLLALRGITEYIVIGTCYGSRTALVGSAADPRVKGVFLLVPPVRSGRKGTGGADHLAEQHGPATLAATAFTPRNIRRLALNKRSRTLAKRIAKAKARSLREKLQPGTSTQKDPTTDVAPDFHQPLRTLLSDGVPVHLLFGTDDFFWSQFQEASNGRLGEDLERFGDLLEVDTVAGTMRGFLSMRIQDISIDRVCAWVAEHA